MKRPLRGALALALFSVVAYGVAPIALNVAITTPAEARRHHGHYHHHTRGRGHYHHWSNYSGRPHAWCGWFMRRQVTSDPGPAFNLARAWVRWGRPAPGPAPGAIGVKPHHVFKVLAVTGPHRVLAISGNDGHAVRTRERSTAGVIAWRM